MDNQERKLRQVMNEYARIETENLIADALILTSKGTPDDLMKAAAASWGFSRSKLYLAAADSLIDAVERDGDEISWSMEHLDAILGELKRHKTPPPDAEVKMQAVVRLQVSAETRTLYAEVLWHFYASSLQHAWHYMLNSLHTLDSAYAVSPDTQKYVEIIRLFRNHMEHRERAIRNIDSLHWQTMSKHDRASVTLGYQRDHKNNLSFEPMDKKSPLSGITQQMPVNREGLQRFRDMITPIYEHLKKVSIERLRQYFITHPDELPALDQVGKTLIGTMELVEAPTK